MKRTKLWHMDQHVKLVTWLAFKTLWEYDISWGAIRGSSANFVGWPGGCQGHLIPSLTDDIILWACHGFIIYGKYPAIIFHKKRGIPHTTLKKGENKLVRSTAERLDEFSVTERRYGTQSCASTVFQIVEASLLWQYHRMSWVHLYWKWVQKGNGPTCLVWILCQCFRMPLFSRVMWQEIPVPAQLPLMAKLQRRQTSYKSRSQDCTWSVEVLLKYCSVILAQICVTGEVVQTLIGNAVLTFVENSGFFF